MAVLPSGNNKRFNYSSQHRQREFSDLHYMVTLRDECRVCCVGVSPSLSLALSLSPSLWWSSGLFFFTESQLAKKCTREDFTSAASVFFSLYRELFLVHLVFSELFFVTLMLRN